MNFNCFHYILIDIFIQLAREEGGCFKWLWDVRELVRIADWFNCPSNKNVKDERRA